MPYLPEATDENPMKSSKCGIRWNNSVSDYFTISNGVKQGGVLSPVLFSIYLDQLIVQLRLLGMSCYMNGLFTGVFIYADDITLLAPSRPSMVLMLEKCESFALTHDILFNASKTKYMIFKRCENVNTAPLYFKNMLINYVHECDLLGITLSSSRTTANVWERQIRSVRRVMSALLSTVGSQLDDECLHTFLCEAAAIINSYPLSVDNLADPDNVMPISPSNFLTMKPSIVMSPPGNFTKDDIYSRPRWRRVQYLSNQFWLKWRSEYLQNIQLRKKWNKPCTNLQVGDFILLKDDNLPRCDWHFCKST